ncbi:DsbA family oxidoreductase [Hoeflea alexandrii]|uniref:DsbA family oxidoreductase n=1 Tax=Hoeflea alexandrii TaxID=288436 RepID=UPI0022AE6AB0|nr:DsbA family oxidoreductase [Hoeflea alexandrii]MCZ4287942.1 DsbA family oxidoreductase [Hoeflea alexandrii]
MTDQTQPLRIDFISDVVCPWCVVGYRQLEQALKSTATDYEIHWHPFELNPDMPAEGQNLREHLAEKYGATPEQSQENRARLTDLGATLGFKFAFTDDMRMVNTFDAHRLIHWAETQGLGHTLKQGLFAAYFSEQRDVSDAAVLIDVAENAGLDATEAKAVLDGQRYAAEVRQQENVWIQNNIRGVPAIIFDNKHLVTGAQGVENYTRILTQLAQMRAA